MHIIIPIGWYQCVGLQEAFLIAIHQNVCIMMMMMMMMTVCKLYENGKCEDIGCREVGDDDISNMGIIHYSNMPVWNQHISR